MKQKIEPGDYIFLKTQSGYVDPSAWQVITIGSGLVELFQPGTKTTKMMTPHQFDKVLQP